MTFTGVDRLIDAYNGVNVKEKGGFRKGIIGTFLVYGQCY